MHIQHTHAVTQTHIHKYKKKLCKMLLGMSPNIKDCNTHSHCSMPLIVSKSIHVLYLTY